MEFNILSYNLRGITTLEKRMKIKAFLTDLKSPIDVFSGQEHKLRRANIEWLKAIWPKADFTVAPALDGVRAARNDRVPVGCGGVFLALIPRLSKMVTAKGVVLFQHAVWAHLEHPKMGKIGILAIYAPNGTNERRALWHELADSMDKHRQWMLAEDYNMVESIEDLKGGSGRVLRGPEKNAWTRLKRKL